MTTLSRRRLLGAGALTALLGAAAACSSGAGSQSLASASSSAAGTAAGSDGLVIGLTYTPNVQFSPFYLALDRGKYAKTVSLRHHGEQEGQFDALLAGTEHLVVAGADEALVAASNGSELVVVGGYYQKYPVCIIVPKSSSVTALADLKGLTIGVPGATGETSYGLTVALATAGLTEADVTIQDVGYTQQAALVSGKVDAVVGFSNNDAVQIAQAGTEVRTLDISTDVPLVGASLVTTRSVLEARRTELADAVVASADGMAAFVEDPDAAVEATLAYVPDLADATQKTRARAVAVATAELVRPSESSVIGEVTVEHIGEALAFLGDQGTLGSTAVTAEEACVPLLNS